MQCLVKFTEWTLSEIIQIFHLSELWRGKKNKTHFVQEVQPYTSPKNSLDRLLPLYAQVKSIK